MGWAETYRALGPKGFASYAAARLAAALPGVDFHRYQLIAVPRSGMPPMPRGFEARGMTDAEIAAADLELSAATIAFRRGQGMTCLGAYRDDRLLGVTWLTDGPFDEDEVAVRFVPPPGAAWDTGLFVLPSERGGRAFAVLWAGTAAWLAERGLDWSMSRMSDYKDGPWRAHARMGAQRLDTLTALRIGGRQWLFGAKPVVLLPTPEAA
ncbi:hypothetical protein ACFOMD_14835 [Sphingoaurantiacus capsulatus]|uniref:GNAT family N-acetyltransferase n=1 Tax=Sphingoaurantiacus capsulatus TaxID=1771310 RepID=A0ABV7XCF7_9SPHN